MNDNTSTATVYLQNKFIRRKKNKIKIQTLNLKNIQKLQKIIRVKNQYLKMDLTSQHPKNKMHLAWKLVFTHFKHTRSNHHYIHDISMILQKTGGRSDVEVVPLWRQEGNRNNDDGC